MICTIPARECCKRAADAARNRNAVLSADVLAPAQSNTNRWMLELHLETRAIPPAISQVFVDHGLAVVEARPRGTGIRAVALIP